MEQIQINSFNTFYYYEDSLVGKYEVRDLATNTVLYSTMSATNYDEFEITSLGGAVNGRVKLTFYDRERCYHNMKIMLYNITTQVGITHMEYFNLGSDGFGGNYLMHPEDCSYYPNPLDIPRPLPFGSFTLTKE